MANHKTVFAGRSRGCRTGAAAALLALLLWLPGPTAMCQVRRPPGSPDSIEDAATRGALLDTEHEADVRIGVARGYIQERKFQPACLVLQKVIDEFGNKLTTTDQRLFVPVRGQVERMLFELPAEGLEVYRQSADGEAKALRAAAAQGDPEAKLAELVRRFFASSLGGDAAYQLGLLLLDRYDFAGARAAFRKAKIHPALSVSQADLLLRLVVASARAHDPDGAATALHELEALGDAHVDSVVLAHLRQEVAAAGVVTTEAGERPSGWPMEYGSPSRDAVMPSLPQAIARGNVDLTFLWPPYRFDLGLKSTGNARVSGAYPGEQMGGGNPATRIARRQDYVTRWERYGWFPAAGMLTADQQIMGKGQDGSPILVSREQIYFQAHDTLTCLDAETGRVLFRAPPESEKKAIALVADWSSGSNLPDQPVNPIEVSLFGDRVSKSISLHNGIVYHLEGVRTMVPLLERGRPNVGPGRTNILAGYDARSGKLAFRVTADALDYSAVRPVSDGADPNGEGRTAAAPPAPGAAARPGLALAQPAAVFVQFLAAPTPCGSNLLVPLEENGTQYVVALDPSGKGKVVWKTMICDGPASGAAKWSPVALAVDGGDVYVAGGRGVIAALDGTDGTVRWAIRYPRLQSDRNPFMGNGASSGLRTAAAGGWDQDAIIVRGGLLMATPSDSSEIFLLDRSTGGPKGPQILRGPFTYCLGISGDGLYLGSKTGLRKYFLSSAKLAWTTLSWGSNMTGRALLTSSMIYVPVRDGIIRIDPETGKQIGAGKLPVAGPAGDPIGSLFTDGTRVYGLGLEYVYALEDNHQRLTALDQKVAGGDLDAQAARGSLRRGLGDLDGAAADFRAVLSRDSGADTREEARRGLLNTLLAQAAAQPGNAEKLLADAAGLNHLPQDGPRIELARAAWNAAQGRIEAAVDLYVKIATAPESGVLIEADPAEPGTMVQAAISAAQGLRKLLADQKQTVEPLLIARSQAALKAAMAGGEVGGLRRIGQVFADTPVGIGATIAAAHAAQATGQLEQAELILQALQYSDQKPTAATGLAALAALYQDAAVECSSGPADKAYLADVFRAQAAQLWGQLRREYAGVRISVIHGVGDLTAPPAPMDALQIADASLAALPGAQSAGARFGPPPWQKLWEDSGASFYIVDTQKTLAAPSAFLDNHVLVYAQGPHKLECRYLYERNKDRLAWSISLPQTGGDQIDDGKVLLARGVAFPGGRILRDGHVGLIWTDKDVSAYGLMGGKRLWRSLDVPAASDTDAETASVDGSSDEVFAVNGPARIRAMEAGQMTSFAGGLSADGSGIAHMSAGFGIVAQHVLDAQRSADMVRVLDSATGTVLWTRTFDRQMVDGLAVTAAGVAVISKGGKEISILDRLTGTQLGRPFDINDRKTELPITWLDRSVIYQNGTELIRRALPEGKMIWHASVTATATRVLPIDHDTLAVVDSNSTRLRVLNLNDTHQWPKQADTFQRQFRDMAVSADGQEIALVGVNDRNEWSLLVLERAKDGKLKGKASFSPQASYIMGASSYLNCDNLVPVVFSDTPRDGGGRYSNTYRVKFFRIHDVKAGDQRGDKVDDTVQLPSARADGKFEGIDQPPRVQGGVLILMSQGAITAYGAKPAVGAESTRGDAGFPATRPSGAAPHF